MDMQKVMIVGGKMLLLLASGSVQLDGKFYVFHHCKYDAVPDCVGYDLLILLGTKKDVPIMRKTKKSAQANNPVLRVKMMEINDFPETSQGAIEMLKKMVM